MKPYESPLPSQFPLCHLQNSDNNIRPAYLAELPEGLSEIFSLRTQKSKVPEHQTQLSVMSYLDSFSGYVQKPLKS